MKKGIDIVDRWCYYNKARILTKGQVCLERILADMR